ncbi:MAG: hypothetical protein HKN16_02940, partial [Saprospiraceae bacterium]|nr:hypothetical protein [Saprospiraceae bacterium]
MRNFLQVLSLLFVATAMNAQVVIVNTPASVQGAYAFSAAAFGANLADSVWTADAIVMDDGVDINTNGCEQTTQDMTGLWAMIDRGACQFGDKCLFAENAGAMGVIVFNNQPSAGPIIMGAGNLGAQVTIPCVMLSFEDGEILKPLAASETMNITIGNLVLPNDVSTERQGASTPLLGTMDQLMYQGLTQDFTPGARVINNGANAATGVTATGVISFDGTEVYNETSSMGVDLMPGDTAFIGLPDFTIGTTDAGQYTVEYTVASDSTDDLAFDNIASTSFSVTEDVICKGAWDFDNGVPQRTSNYRTTAAGSVEYVAGFRTPTAGLVLDSVTYNISTSSTSGSLEGAIFGVWVYRWQDADEDMLAQPAELTRVGLGLPEFGAGAPGATWVTNEIIGITDPKVITGPDDDGYFVGVKFADTDSLFVGFNENNNVSWLLEQSLIENEADVPHHVVTTFDGETPDIAMSGVFTDSGFPIAIAVHTAEVSNVNAPPIAGELKAYPNPVEDFLTVDLDLEVQTSEVTFHI